MGELASWIADRMDLEAFLSGSFASFGVSTRLYAAMADALAAAVVGEERRVVRAVCRTLGGGIGLATMFGVCYLVLRLPYWHNPGSALALFAAAMLLLTVSASLVAKHGSDWLRRRWCALRRGARRYLRQRRKMRLRAATARGS